MHLFFLSSYVQIISFIDEMTIRNRDIK